MRGLSNIPAIPLAGGRSGETLPLTDFWQLEEIERERLLLRGIAASHSYHYERNTAYRNTVAGRGVGFQVRRSDLPRLLRTTSHAFKSYVDILATPFPQDEPRGFAEWLSEQLSVDMHLKQRRFRSRYSSLESLLRAIEHQYSGPGLEMLLSTGTSGRTTIVPHDRSSTGLMGESFSLCFLRYLGIEPAHRAILTMPTRTRLAVDRVIRVGLKNAGLPADRVNCTIRFAAYPDRVRVLSGQTFRTGWRGALERGVKHPIVRLVEDKIVDAQAVESALSRLVPASAHGERVVLFGSLDRLHGIASVLLDGGRTVTLRPGSLLCTVGGTKNAGPLSASRMREDMQEAFRLSSGQAVPIRDIYGMAEANWAAMQCSRGNYHVPPWVHAVTLDDREVFQGEERATGRLAFYDPFGGGDLFPAFFSTEDRVTLVRGIPCPCGEPGSYLEEASIDRIELPIETGCAAQL